MRAPRIVYDEQEGSAGYHAGTALDELVAFALEEGCGEDELRERLEESIERAADE